TPGLPQDQSPYRSELIGLLAGIMAVDWLLEQWFPNISIGPKVRIACDGLSAIEMAFEDRPLSPTDAQFDLVSSIWEAILRSLVDWAPQHVYGHLDKSNLFDELSWWEKRNLEVDGMAVEYRKELETVPDEIEVHGDEATLADALLDGRLRVISDGSFKNELGTAAVQILVKHGGCHRIIIRCQTPGLPQDQSPYRSELIGLLAGIMAVDWLLEQWFPNISIGPKVRIACDGLSAIEMAFEDRPLSPTDAQFDLVSSIWEAILRSLVDWAPQHVYGHLDKSNLFDELSWWEKRNLEVDGMAVEYRKELETVPDEIEVHGDEATLADALLDGRLRVISDGSFKNELGTAAVQILVKHGGCHRIIIRCQTPGLPQDQSPYRSELIGLLAGIMAVDWLLEQWFPNISIGPKVRIACDGLSAIEMAFEDRPLSPTDAQFDLVSSIWEAILRSLVDWAPQHVYGHLDKSNLFDELSWWEKRNLEVDGMAVEYRKELETVPDEIEVHGDEATLADALLDGRLRVISDGSFKNELGTAAVQI
ncbi:unnamed protein product, partial [Cylindrotheca closterium]